MPMRDPVFKQKKRKMAPEILRNGIQGCPLASAYIGMCIGQTARQTNTQQQQQPRQTQIYT